MKLLTSFEAIVRTSGIALFVALLASVVILETSPTDSGQRGFGNGAVDAVCWLYLVWAALALIGVALRRPSGAKGFWLVFATNMSIVSLMLANFLLNR